jgi:acyl-CoA synthetase (AMP-forming)/AMP-acid ligase II
LEKVFNAPAIESYGMTEASHQMASNPLPPFVRKPGSLGVAAGPEIAIMDEAGNLLPPKEVGEVVIRGANITRGYENNPQANAKAFTNGWFRTGDLGYLDENGYLFLKGRLKEIINRGGEKISPIEVFAPLYPRGIPTRLAEWLIHHILPFMLEFKQFSLPFWRQYHD